jgi:hypothetical protein
MEMILIHYIITFEVAMITIGSAEIFINFNGRMAPVGQSANALGMSMDAAFC